MIFLFSAPEPVSEITVSNGGKSDALQVSWRPVSGVVDSYLVCLEERKGISKHKFVVSHSSPPECSFRSLEAGRLYSVVIKTRSGDLETAATVLARTRKNPVLLKSYICLSLYLFYHLPVLFVLKLKHLCCFVFCSILQNQPLCKIQ